MKVHIFLLWMSVFTLLCSGCQRSHLPISKTGFAFNTVVTLSLYDTDDTELLDSCFALCADYEQKFSKTIPTSDVGRINAAAGKPVTVSDDTVHLLKKAVYYSELSGGLFDITIEPVTALWDFHSEAAIQNTVTPPDKSSISSALKHVDYHNIQIENNTVTLLDPNASIDLGGIAKGYIADQLKNYLLEHGVRSAIIDLGGNIQTIGSKSDNSPFCIGIRRPFEPSGDLIASIKIKDQSIVTSGIYERCFTYQGKLYHHILSPATGFPVESGLNSVSVIAASSADCDALSTICLLLGLDNGMKLIKSLPDTEAVFITKDNQIHTTTNRLLQ